MSSAAAVRIENLIHRYRDRPALGGVSFHVDEREIFALLGPNGGGKTTLFRILSTSFPPTSGQVQLFGRDLVRNAAEMRRHLGVVFQSPSLDKKLTAAENLWHHGHLYGLKGRPLGERINDMLSRVGLVDRAGDRTERLSGGQQRRVEVAKGLLHRPRLLLLDEPSTGLDPGARRDLWQYLRQVRDDEGVTILLTTHLMEEAEQCDRVGILHRGSLVALGTPKELGASVGEEVVSLESEHPQSLAEQIRASLNLASAVVDGTVRIEHARGHELVARLFELLPGQIRSATVRRPSLEDVFIAKTGRNFWAEETARSESRN